MKIIGKILTKINHLFIYFQRLIYLIFLLRSKQLGLIDDWHYSIKREWVSKRKQFGLWDHFYQTHPKLSLNGVRPTVSRINNYKLTNYIDDDSVVLDIGCNTGFFSAYLSGFVKHIDAVELNKDVFAIATKTMNYLGISNISLFNTDIKKFKSSYKYDLVMSFAIHRWVGLDLVEYLSLLEDYKKEKGFLIIESHPEEQDKLTLKATVENSKFNIIARGVTDDHLGHLRDFYILN